MARYHFHTKDGRCVEDTRGTELPSLMAAKDRAVQVLAEQFSGSSDLLLKTGDFAVIVTDDNGLTLFHIDVLCVDSPAAAHQTLRTSP